MAPQGLSQGGPQLKFLQTSPDPQARPHLPQLLRSLLKSAHTPPQQFWVLAEHTLHAPPPVPQALCVVPSTHVLLLSQHPAVHE